MFQPNAPDKHPKPVAHPQPRACQPQQPITHVPPATPDTICQVPNVYLAAAPILVQPHLAMLHPQPMTHVVECTPNQALAIVATPNQAVLVIRHPAPDKHPKPVVHPQPRACRPQQPITHVLLATPATTCQVPNAYPATTPAPALAPPMPAVVQNATEPTV